MKQFAAFVRKEFCHIFRDRRTMLILLGLPVALLVILGFAISTEVNNSRLMVLSPTTDATVQRMTHRLAANPRFVYVGKLSSVTDVDRAFRQGRTDIVVGFSPDFERGLQSAARPAAIQIWVDATDPNTASMMVNYARGVLLSEMAAGQGHDWVTVQSHLLFNPQMKSAYNFVPGVMGLIMMLICAMMTSISIVREKETGTMEVLLVTPVSPLLIILSKVVPYFLLSCVNLLSVLVVAVWVLHVPVAGSLWLLSVLSLVFVFVAVSLGLLISTLARTQVAAMLLAGLSLMMPTMLLSGMIFPIESMPVALQLLAEAIPARWYIAAVRKVMIAGMGWSSVWTEFLVLCGMAVVLLTASLSRFKKRLD